MATETFKNRFLIAMPTLNDPYFHQTVILLFEHSDKGAMGLIVNKPLDISLGEILQHLNIPLTNSELDENKVMLGGPVASEQGFIIHTHPELCPGDVIDEEKKITVSASKEVLQNIVESKPDNILVCLGYSAWKEGQIEQEITDNAWMVSDVNPEILFQLPYKERWKASAMQLGVDFDRLSSDVGHG
ncbi:MAG: YqgE/AlgH family protein [Gammaproteobacteria bacterium]|nr:YqgE/AlgH family protein [Gammaproteobacteria bacterium]